MRIQTKIAIALSLACALCAAALLLQAMRLERSVDAYRQTIRAQKGEAFDAVFKHVSASYKNYVVDMTFWDETAAFIKEPDERWAEENVDISAETFDIAFVALFDLAGNPVYFYKDEDFGSGPENLFPKDFWKPIFREGERFANFYQIVEGDVFELYGATIHLTEDAQRLLPPHGYFVIGKRYTADHVQQISQATSSSVKIHSGDEAPAAPAQEKSQNNIRIERALRDAWGQPVATLEASYGIQELTAFASNTRKDFLLISLLAISSGLLLLLFVSQWLRSPLLRIEKAIAAEDRSLIDSLAHSRSEFATICRMLVKNFQQRAALDNEIAERRQIQNQLAQARDDAEAANRAKSEFLANMSHEIRTPMNAILGFTELAQGQTDDPELQEYLSYIENGGEMLLSLINDILDTSKIEAGKMLLHPSPCDLGNLVEELVTLLRLTAETKGIELRLDAPQCHPPGLLVDGTKLRQVLINLIGNAIKFTREGHVTLRYTYQLSSNNTASLEFQVQDTGIGIAPEEVANVFEAFRQQKDQDHARFGGTGLGLSLSSKLVDLMGGSLDLESELGKGSVFSFTLPQAPLCPEDEDGRLSADPSQKAIPDLSGSRILVVEDNPANRELFRKALQATGAAVSVAENGEKGLQHVQETSFDLILTDWRMPRVDGVALLEALRADPLSSAIPVAMLSASATAEDRDAFLQKGFAAVLAKPVKCSHLWRLCQKHLAKSKSR